MKLIKIGTRKSPLAMAQSRWVADRMGAAKNGAMAAELIGIVTEGDKEDWRKDGLKQLADGKGIFVKALDEALLARKIDAAVHSAKDVPAEMTPGVEIAAVPEREDVADLLVSVEGFDLESLPRNSKVGTSSLRRAAMLRFIRPDIEIVNIRGNVETRLSRISGPAAVCSAVILAAAGIRRLGGEDTVLKSRNLNAARLDPSIFLPAPAQGALMIVSRKADVSDFAFISDPDSETAVRIERQVVARLGADCSWPLGAWARRRTDSREWILDAAILSSDGKLRVRDSISGESPDSIADVMVERLIAKGGKKIIEVNRNLMRTT